VDSHERKRLYHEATEFLALRAERLKWVRKGGDFEQDHRFRAGSIPAFRKRLTPPNGAKEKKAAHQDAGHGLGDGGCAPTRET